MARLGFGSTLFGCVGNDDFGRLNIERLRLEGVITDGISVIDKAPTGTAFVSYRNPLERDFIFNIPNSACGFFTADHIDLGLLNQCQHFHIMGSSLFSFRIIDAMRRAIQIVKANKGTVSFDPNIRKEMLNIPEMSQAFDYILEYTDIFLPSEGEVHHFASSKNQQEADIVQELLASGVSHIVIKRGEKGPAITSNKMARRRSYTLQAIAARWSIRPERATALALPLSACSCPASAQKKRCSMPMPAVPWRFPIRGRWKGYPAWRRFEHFIAQQA